MNNENNNMNNNLNNGIDNIGVDSFFNPQINNDPNNTNIGMNNNLNNSINSSVPNPNMSNNNQMNNSINTVFPNTNMNDNSGVVTEGINPNNTGIDSTIANNDINQSVNNNQMNNSIDTGINTFNNQQNVNMPKIDFGNIDNNVSNNVSNSMNVTQPINNVESNTNNLNNQSVEPRLNTINSAPNNNINTNVPKKSNKSLVIVLIVSIVVAIASAVVAYLIVTNNKSKTENDYENNSNNVISNTTDTTQTVSDNTNTIENDGFIYTKKAGYEYEVDEGALYVYGSNSMFQFIVIPTSLDEVFNRTSELEQVMTNYGYTFTNKNTTAYDGKNVLTYEISNGDINALYIVYAAPDANYSVQVIAIDKNSTFNYNLVTEAMSLTNDLENSGNSTLDKTSNDFNVPKISDKLINKINE